MTPSETSVPYGFCHCGCGGKTRIAKKTQNAIWHIKGQPMKFIHGHNTIKSLATHTVIDTGYRTPCWIWDGSKSHGYGINKRIRGPRKMAHVIYYERDRGPVPDGLQLDHLCRITDCVNPDHLEAVTNTVNTQRSSRAKLTPKTVRLARELSAQGKSYCEIGRMLSVHNSTVRLACIGKAWINIT